MFVIFAEIPCTSFCSVVVGANLERKTAWVSSFASVKEEKMKFCFLNRELHHASPSV